jgi:hypothetical protein
MLVWCLVQVMYPGCVAEYMLCQDRAIVQAVSRRLPNVAARVLSQVRSRGIYGGRSGTGASLLRVLRFPTPIFISPNAPYSSIILGWYNRRVTGRYTCIKWQSHPLPLNCNYNYKLLLGEEVCPRCGILSNGIPSYC